MRTIQNSFIAGELTPSLHSRHDLKAYFNGAQRIHNMTVIPQGGARKRMGTDIQEELTSYAPYKLIPFYYDRETCILVVLTTLKAYFIEKDISDQKYYFVTELGNTTPFYIATPFAASELTNINHYQIGDTVYLCSPERAVAKLKRYGTRDWTITTIYSSVSVATPAALTATAADIGADGADYTQKYALVAMKDGVLSPKRQASAAIHVPWPVGQKVTLSWTPETSASVDGYKLLKYLGASWGLLAEILPYPAQISATGRTYASSDAPASPVWFEPTARATAVKAAEPNATTNIEIKLPLTKNAIYIPKQADGTVTLRFKPTLSSAIATINFLYTPVTASWDKREYVSPYAGTETFGAQYQLRNSTDTTTTAVLPVWIEHNTPYALNESAASTTYRRFVITIPSSDTGIVLQAVSVKTSAEAEIAGSWALPLGSTDYAYTINGTSGTTYLNTNRTILSLDYAADYADLTVKSCSPVRYATGAHANTMLLTPSTSKAIITVTAAAPILVTDLRIYLGARAIAPTKYTSDPITAVAPNATAVQVFSSTDGGTNWTSQGTTNLTNAFSDSMLLIALSSPPVNATAWKLEFTAADGNVPVVIRGGQFFETTIDSSYVDINHVPTVLVGDQTNIEPGDSADMSVRAVAMYQQRLVLASSNTNPFRLWFSQIGNFDMWYANRPMMDDDPFAATIPAIRASEIRHMISDRMLIVFTEGGVYTVDGTQDGFTYRSCTIRKVANIGASRLVKPASATNTSLFLADDNKTLYELRYDFAQDSLVPLDRAVLASHIFETRSIVGAAMQENPERILWCIMSDGTLCSFTYLPEHEVYAWSTHTLPDGWLAQDIIIPGSIRDQAGTVSTTDVLLIIRNSDNKDFLCTMRSPINTNTPTVDVSATLDLRHKTILSLNVSTSATIATLGASYPAGSAVNAVNLATGTAYVYTSDGTDLTRTAAVPTGQYILGIPVETTLDTLRPELPDTSLMGYRRNVTKLVIRTRRSGSVTVSPLEPLGSVAARTLPLTPPACTNGAVELPDQELHITPSGHWNKTGQTAITTTHHWPLEILSVAADLEVERS